MKFVMALIFSASSVFAAIKGSFLDQRHQNLIQQAVAQKCGLRTPLVQTSHVATPIYVDQGVVDYQYTTTLSTFVEIDQGQGDEVQLVVYSRYTDAYDHAAGNWGVYSVDMVHSQNTSCH